MRTLILALTALTLASPAAAAPRRPVKNVLVRLDTSLGAITVMVDLRHAPITGANFLSYVDEHRYDGVTFYRTARKKTDPSQGFIQGGVHHQAQKSNFPIPHEPTTRTGLRHDNGAISMARNDPGTAAGDFFIVVGAASYLDAKPPNYPGYAVFGHVVSGMPVVKRILAAKTYTGGFTANTMGQSISEDIRIRSARRVGTR